MGAQAARLQSLDRLGVSGRETGLEASPSGLALSNVPKTRRIGCAQAIDHSLVVVDVRISGRRRLIHELDRGAIISALDDYNPESVVTSLALSHAPRELANLVDRDRGRLRLVVMRLCRRAIERALVAIWAKIGFRCIDADKSRRQRGLGRAMHGKLTGIQLVEQPRQRLLMFGHASLRLKRQ